MSEAGAEIEWTRHLLACRSGQRCECCGKPIRRGERSSMHHRLPRGMGGSKLPGTHGLDRLLLVHGDGTSGCHWWLEEAVRGAAYDLGLLVPRGQDPAAWPLVLASGRRVLLDPGAPLYLPAPGPPYHHGHDPRRATDQETT